MEVKLAELPAVIGRYLLLIQPTDLLDIAIMIFVLYKVFMLVQSTKAASLLKGLLVFLAALMLSSVLQLHGVYYIMSSMVEWGVLALIILFQPEIQHHGADHRAGRPGLHRDVAIPYRRLDRV